jgi:phage tail sheath gpL-like
MSSDAVSINRKSRILGYKLDKGNFQTSSPNLPQRIAVLAEANEANQATLDLTPTPFTTAQAAGVKYGYGSPIYHLLRILIPQFGGGVNGIPVVVYPQAKASGATAKVIEITPTGVATDNGTHTLIVAGRTGIDGKFYDLNIVEGDTTADITAKIEDALNNILGCPVTCTSTDYVASATSKWKGLTAEGISITVDTGDDDLGITYTVENITAGSGTPDVSDALELFGNEWNTIVVNSYGAVSSVMQALETFNGIPSPTNPTGRYYGIIMKPFIALTGSVAEDPSSITDGRLDNVTIAICPAPLSAGLAMEAAANMAVLFATVSQNTPNLDVAGKPYPDMPTPTVIGAMSEYENRDAIVQKGCSTVDLVAGKYVVQDFVTTYHPVGETPAQFAYARNLIIDFNVRYGYYLLEQIHVVDHSISNDDDFVTATNVIKPKQWKQINFTYAEDLAKRGLTVDKEFMQESIRVDLSTTNPDRLETNFQL